MFFDARVYIQGVGVYVPHEARPDTEMLVLFPKQEIAEAKGVSTEKNPICRHHAVVQFSARCLESSPLGAGQGSLPEISLTDSSLDAWATIDVSGLWIGIKAQPMAPKTRLAIDGRVPGVPYLQEILDDHISPIAASSPLYQSIHPGAFPNGSSEADFLQGGLYFDQGVLSPYAEFEGLYRFPASRQYGAKGVPTTSGPCPNPDDHKLSSVLKLELGQVKSFVLLGRSFKGDRSFELPLQPPSDPDGVPWDELEIWVRHFCDLDRPDPDGKTAEPGEPDVDFALNYMVLEHLDDVLKALGNKLPVPSVSESWGRGGLIGSEARKCMGNAAKPASFTNPLS